MKRLPLFAFALLATLVACNSTPQKPSGEQPAAEQPKAPQATYYTGREALQKMYIAARSWAPDAKPYALSSQPTKGDNGQDGKAGLWRAGFASASRRSIKSFSWSGIKAEDMPEPGISASTEDTYNPTNSSTQVFDVGFLKVDSDAAYKASESHGEKLLKKDPETPVAYSIQWNPRENALYWHVLYGGSGIETKLNVVVDATTGKFVEIAK